MLSLWSDALFKVHHQFNVPELVRNVEKKLEVPRTRNLLPYGLPDRALKTHGGVLRVRRWLDV